VEAVSLSDTASDPLGDMSVPFATVPEPSLVELTVHCTFWLGLFLPVTTALNRRVSPAVIDVTPPAALTATASTDGLAHAVKANAASAISAAAKNTFPFIFSLLNMASSP
jgi:hypothetical protein